MDNPIKAKFKVGDVLKVKIEEVNKAKWLYPISGYIKVDEVHYIGDYYVYGHIGLGRILREHMLEYSESHLLNEELKELYGK